MALVLAFCIIPNPFAQFGADAYEALWHVNFLCMALLAIEALLLFRLKIPLWASGIVSGSVAGAAVLTIIDGRMAATGPLICDSLLGVDKRAVESSMSILNTLQQTSIFLVRATIILLAFGVLVVIIRHIAGRWRGERSNVRA